MKRNLSFAALLMSVLVVATTVEAQEETYPVRSIKMICGFPAGSSLDVITRIYAARLERALGQPVTVENREALPAIWLPKRSCDPHQTVIPC
jgi:tripartite-type tricarboxylate transporter receptor subunit TctC